MKLYTLKVKKIWVKSVFYARECTICNFTVYTLVWQVFVLLICMWLKAQWRTVLKTGK